MKPPLYFHFTMDCKVRRIVREDVNPVVVNFQNGTLEDSERSEDFKVTFLRKTRSKTAVAVANKKMLYVGDTADHEYDTYLVVVNKPKPSSVESKCKLIKVDHASLSPYFPKEDFDGVNASKTLTELNKEFGSKRAKRRTEHYERMNMDIDNVREELEQTVADITVNPDDITAAVENPVYEENYRPPINRDASTKERVYRIGELIDEKVLDALESKARSVLETNVEVLDMNSYTKKRLQDLKNSTTHKDTILKKCKILLFVDCLLKFLLTNARQVSNKNYTVCDYCSDVNDHVLDKFTVSSGNKRTRPITMRDKAVCYSLVLLLLVSDFTIDVEDLSKELKIGINKMKEIGKFLALSATGNKLTLKLPLPAPYVKSPNKRKRK